MKSVSPTSLALRALGLFFSVFFVSAVVLFIVDFVPEKPGSNNAPEENVSEEVLVAEQPTRIVIPTIGVDTIVSNPLSDTIEVLDTALLQGAVRYPSSALLGELGTVYLFGHQSYLPVVKNKAFKAFNDLQKLSAGDTIIVYSDTATYEYVVRSVSLVTASDALIPLDAPGKVLYLSTCNSFGTPGERYVVEAEYRSRNIN